MAPSLQSRSSATEFHPSSTINISLANVLSACINSTGTSTACSTLFSNAKDASGNLPSDTATAALNIAHNPGANITALYNLSVPAPPSQPSTSAPPTTGPSPSPSTPTPWRGPYYPAVDALGNIWVPAYANNTLTEFDPQGIPLSGYSAFSGNLTPTWPYAVAIDSGQSAWVANYAYGAPAVVSRFSPNGSANGNFPCGKNCTAVAIDSVQNIWVAANSGSTTMHNSGISISQFSTTGVAPSLAIDSSGHGWSLGTSRNLYKLTLPNTVAPYSEGVTSTLANDLTQFAIDSSDNVWFTTAAKTTRSAE